MATPTNEATRAFKNELVRNIIAGATLNEGQIIRTEDGLAAVVMGGDSRLSTSSQVAVSGDQASIAYGDEWLITSASATTFSVGDPVYWDDSASQAVPVSAALDGSTDFYIGVATRAKADGDATVQVMLNGATGVGQPIVYEFDCQTGVDSASHILIPAEMNPNGLIINEIFAQVTEQFAGGTEDQGIVTVSDESDNALATLTAADASADAVDDILVGYQRQAASSGDALLVVAAGEFIDAAVTQETSGASVAGKMKVFVSATPSF
ncbi:MAG: capsid cement protein [Planctomycetota bacterium]|jgi:predicted RecA/RadA family phage recombinase